MADVFLNIDRNDDKAAYFKKSQENFRAAAVLHDPPIEIITVKCGDEEYDGYFCHPRYPKPGKWPAIFFIGGADAFAEEIYFSGKEMCERGYAMLLVDTPGRGSSMYVKNIPTRADYEVPGKACFDYSKTGSRYWCHGLVAIPSSTIFTSSMTIFSRPFSGCSAACPTKRRWSS